MRSWARAKIAANAEDIFQHILAVGWEYGKDGQEINSQLAHNRVLRKALWAVE